MGGALIGSGTVLSHATISGRNIPANVVLHSLKLADGHFVTRIYGVADNPKEGTFWAAQWRHSGTCGTAHWFKEVRLC